MCGVDVPKIKILSWKCRAQCSRVSCINLVKCNVTSNVCYLFLLEDLFVSLSHSGGCLSAKATVSGLGMMVSAAVLLSYMVDLGYLHAVLCSN